MLAEDAKDVAFTERVMRMEKSLVEKCLQMGEKMFAKRVRIDKTVNRVEIHWISGKVPGAAKESLTDICLGQESTHNY